jgi:hypothetical protein
MDRDVEYHDNGDDRISLIINPRFFTSKSVDPGSQYYFLFSFNNAPNIGGLFPDYDYASATFGNLQPAILEVHTW